MVNRMRRASCLLPALLGLIAVTCYQPQRRDCAIVCGDGSLCPAGMQCSNGRCVTRGGRCSPPKESAEPAPRPCAHGSTRCNAQGTAVEICNSEGPGWTELEVCGASTPICSEGVCRGCVPGTGRCEGPTERAICGTDSVFEAPSACPSWAPRCIGGECSPAASVAAGGAHACAKLRNDDVVCWGENSSGQLGVGDTLRRGSSADDPPLEKVALGAPALAVTAGGAHACALLEGGIVKCWGQNRSGQLGLGDVATRGDEPGEVASLAPVALGSSRTPIAVSAGDRHTCALFDDGSVKCWGANESGQLGLGDTETRGDEPAELGDDLPSVRLGAAAIAIDAGASHTCALLADGGVTCWGDNGSGQLGTGDTENHGSRPFAPDESLPRAMLGAGRAVAVSAGGDHSCAVLGEGDVVCWGYNAGGQLGVGDTAHRGRQREGSESVFKSADLGVARALAVAAGANHTCALLTDRRILCWGINVFGTAGLGSPDARIGDEPGELGDTLSPVDLGSHQGDARTAAALSAGLDFTCAVLDGDAVKCWGINSSGQLGLGDTASRGDDADELGDRLPAIALE